MRELKFRVWDKSVEHLYEVQTLIDGGDAIGRYVLNGEMNYIHLCADEIIVEQYTGLKDKNGEEIYEGDIVDEDGDGDRLFEVKWSEREGCYYVGDMDFHGQINQTYARGVEVIGNIHENGDLLSDTDVTNKEEE